MAGVPLKKKWRLTAAPWSGEYDIGISGQPLSMRGAGLLTGCWACRVVGLSAMSWMAACALVNTYVRTDTSVQLFIQSAVA